MSPLQIKQGLCLVDLLAVACCNILPARLKPGHKISTCTSVEINTAARQFIAKLFGRYPHLLAPSAVQGFDTKLRNKVEQIGITQLENYAAHYGGSRVSL